MMALGIFGGLAMLVLLATSKGRKSGSVEETNLPPIPKLPPSAEEKTILTPDGPITTTEPVPANTPVVKTEVKTMETPKGTVAVPVTTETKTIITPEGVPVHTETKTVHTSDGPVQTPTKVVAKPTTQTKTSQQKWYEVNSLSQIVKADMKKFPKYLGEDSNKPKRWSGSADRLFLFSYDKANKPSLIAYGDGIPGVRMTEAAAEFTKRVLSGSYPFVWMLVRPSDKEVGKVVTISKHVKV